MGDRTEWAAPEVKIDSRLGPSSFCHVVGPWWSAASHGIRKTQSGGQGHPALEGQNRQFFRGKCTSISSICVGGTQDAFPLVDPLIRHPRLTLPRKDHNCSCFSPPIPQSTINGNGLDPLGNPRQDPPGPGLCRMRLRGATARTSPQCLIPGPPFLGWKVLGLSFLLPRWACGSPAMSWG